MQPHWIPCLFVFQYIFPTFLSGVKCTSCLRHSYYSVLFLVSRWSVFLLINQIYLLLLLAGRLLSLPTSRSIWSNLNNAYIFILWSQISKDAAKVMIYLEKHILIHTFSTNCYSRIVSLYITFIILYIFPILMMWYFPYLSHKSDSVNKKTD